MPPAPPRILVLGAAGSVGRAITAALSADTNLFVTAGLHRPFAAAPDLGAPHLARPRARIADATNILELIAAFDGMTHVINAVGGSPDTLRRSAVAICAAARAHPALRLVHISSMAVYGPATGQVSEDAGLVPDTRYAAAKIAAEREVTTHAAHGLNAVILRPGIVHGPHSAQWTARLTRLLQARRLGDLGPAGDGFCNLTYEADLAAACLAACLRPEAAGQAFNVAIPDPPTWNSHLIDLARGLGATPVQRITARRLRLETRLLAPALALAGKLAGRARIPDPIPPSLLRLFAHRIRLDPTRADTVLRFPRTQAALTAAHLAAE